MAKGGVGTDTSVAISTGLSVSSRNFICDLLIGEKIQFEAELSFSICVAMMCHITGGKTKKRKKNGRMTNWLSPERQEHLHSHCQYHLCSVSLWLSLFLAFFPLNCLIIHLRALIYPPSSALYVRPLCETFSWISNELVAYKVFLPGKAPIYGHVCLFSININPLGEERPYAIFSRTVPGTSLGRKSHCSVSLVSQRLLGWKYKIINFVFSIRTHDL